MRYLLRALLRLTLLATAGLCLGATSGCNDESTSASASGSSDPAVRLAQERVRAQMRPRPGYRGPHTGPEAQSAELIVFVAADVTNGGVAGAAAGVREAARVIGWPVRILDGHASVAGRTEAMGRAIALAPDGIILGGFDPTEQEAAMRRAAQQGIPVVGWHAGPTPGPKPSARLFTNVTTNPLAVARLAASYVVARSQGRAGAVILYDSQFQIAVAKQRAMRAELERCARCTVLDVVDTPIAEAEARVPPLVSPLLRRHGSKLTYILTINGKYVAASRPALFAAGRRGTEPPFAVAAGDGDASEFERIRTGDYQAASVAEPLYLHGWQLVDELNRALARVPASGYVAPPQLVTRQNVPSGAVFEPAVDYRAQYRRLWRR